MFMKYIIMETHSYIFFIIIISVSRDRTNFATDEKPDNFIQNQLLKYRNESFQESSHTKMYHTIF